MVGWQEGYLACRKPFLLIPRGFFQTNGEGVPEGEAADRGLPGKTAIKWK